MNFVKSLILWFMNNLKNIVLVILVMLLIAVMAKEYAPMYNKQVKEAEFVMLEPIQAPKPKEVVPEYCEPIKEYIFKTDDFLARKNVVVLDLDTFDNFKNERIDKDRVGHYYRLTGKEKTFYTVFKNEPISNSTK